MTSNALAHRVDATPSMPNAAEWNAAITQAQTLALTQIVPKEFRNKPHDIMAVWLIGREMGLSPMTALQYIDMIDGRPSVSPELMNARIRSKGHRLRIVEWTTETCTLEGIRGDNGETDRATFTLDDARRAGLVKERSNWEKYPKAMLFARAMSMLARAVFPDAIMGVASYTPEELGAEVDEDGRVINKSGRGAVEALPDELRAAMADAEEVEIVSEATPAEVFATIDGEAVGGADGEFATMPPPEPPTPEEAHRLEGDDLFKYGWPAKGRSGDSKGKPPYEVTDDDLAWFSTQTSKDPKYAALDDKRRAWCKREIVARAAAVEPDVDPAPVAADPPKRVAARRRPAPAAAEPPAPAETVGEPVADIVTPERYSEVGHHVKLLDAEERSMLSVWGKAEGIQWLPDAMTVEMADAIVAKVDELLPVETEEEPALEGEIEEPVEQAAPVDEVQAVADAFDATLVDPAAEEPKKFTPPPNPAARRVAQRRPVPTPSTTA